MNGMYGMGQPMQQMQPDPNQPQQPLGGIPAGGDARARMLAEMLMKQGQKPGDGSDTIAGGLNNAMKSYLMMKYGMNGQGQGAAPPSGGGGMMDGIGSIFSKLGGMFGIGGGGAGGGAYGATGGAVGGVPVGTNGLMGRV